MFIYNFKFNGKAFIKLLFILIAIVILIYLLCSTYKVYHNSFKVRDNVRESDVMYLTHENYTNILKSVHDNIDEYIGKKICFRGYVYRLIDFKETEFVLARDMIISSDMKTLIVGFLCDCKDIKNFKNNTWVEVTGEITKGSYHGDIPLINVEKINEIEKPKDNIYVYPPDDKYIPTSTMF